jgi:YD repeat-containing protein
MGMFGNNWRSTYEERIFLGSDGLIKYARANGSFWSFWNLGQTTYYIAAPANQTVTLTSGTSWTLTFQNGEQRIFNINSGSLNTIVDRYGNTTQLTYDAANRLVTVTDPALRHLYFWYQSPSSSLVSSVTSDVGLTITYAYDSSNRLVQVTENDGSKMNYTYDSNSMITSVTDSNGKILEAHTYDSQGRGLTSVRANGVEAITVSYQ